MSVREGDITGGGGFNIGGGGGSAVAIRGEISIYAALITRLSPFGFVQVAVALGASSTCACASGALVKHSQYPSAASPLSHHHCQRRNSDQEEGVRAYIVFRELN